MPVGAGGVEGAGRGVRVAIIDSGVNPTHPHVGGVAGGVAIDVGGREHDDYLDRLGHGTAVTAAIREKAPEAELFAVKVFDGSLSASVGQLVGAIDWAARHRMRLINLSLGTANAEHEAALRAAVDRAAAGGALIVSACEHEGVRWLPGSLPRVVPVLLDWDCPREAFRMAVGADGVMVFHASGFPRGIPGVPPEHNLKGISFAVANMTGILTRALETHPDASFEEVLRLLRGCEEVQ